MEMSLEHRRRTGAFYTPKVWAELAVDYMRLVCPKPLEEYVFYDPSAGEGALLEALPKDCEKFGTTLEDEDVQILRQKGFKAWQFDFFYDNTLDLPTHLYIKRKRLVVFMNPPYFKLGKEQGEAIKQTYGTNDSVAIFLHRVINELKPAFVFMFGKTDLIQAPMLRNTRKDLRLMGGVVRAMFICPSMSWGLSGKFPIALYAIDPNINNDTWTSPNLCTNTKEGVLKTYVYDSTKRAEAISLIKKTKALAWHWEAVKRMRWDQYNKDLSAEAFHPYEYETNPLRYWYEHLEEDERERIIREYELMYPEPIVLGGGASVVLCTFIRVNSF